MLNSGIIELLSRTPARHSSLLHIAILNNQIDSDPTNAYSPCQVSRKDTAYPLHYYFHRDHYPDLKVFTLGANRFQSVATAVCTVLDPGGSNSSSSHTAA